MDRNQILDKFLEFFRKENENKVTPLDTRLHLICKELEIDYHRDSGEYIKELIRNGIIRKAPNGLHPDSEFYSFKGFLYMDLEKLRIEILKEIQSSYFSGSQIDITEFILKRCATLNSKILYQVLSNMIEQGLINTGSYGFLKNSPSRNVSEVLSAGHKIFAKIIKAGYFLLHPPQLNEINTGDTIHASGGAVVVTGGGNNVSVNKNFSKEDISKAIPLLIEFFKDIRSEDVNMLLEAYKADKMGEKINPVSYEKIISILANITTIVQAFLPK